ncbi:DUF3817 domain-containing protein [Microbacterium gorillae]|uniref:DUF3817 domain-containing protein n=1 Tax=Microbacterium gorillae TaxID=1231063 RepID=UPI00058E829A|nr:DUF3817 domain-containing protein [Microbacterium gorillae]
MFRTPQKLFRVLAFAEVVTWTILIAALIARALGADPIVATIGGGIHGFIFLSYGATAILVALNQRWGVWPAVVAIASAVIPYATIPTEIWLQRSGRLDGPWRLTAGDDPRDRRWYDRWMRFFLNRPWALALIIVVAIVALYVALLVIGPPGGNH